MTTETPICSISSNVNPIGSTKKLSSDSNHEQRKRNFIFNNDKIENLQVHENEATSPSSTWNKLSSRLLSWIFCGPCITFIRTSTTCHRILLTTVTLSVTLLLVASPILFLISATPAISHSNQIDDCGSTDDCSVTPISSFECTDDVCRDAARSIRTRINFSSDACMDFKSFCCSDLGANTRAFKTPQQIVDHQMLNLLLFNTSIGAYRKLGRLYESCLRQEINSSTIRLVVEQLGGILPINALGPSNAAMTFSKILSEKFGAPMPLLDIYFDLSYGKNPQIIMIIDVPSDITKVLQNPVRWKVPRAPVFKIELKLPKLFDRVLDFLLPNTLNEFQRQSEKREIINFVEKLNEIRKEHIDKDFSSSYVINNVSALADLNSFTQFKECLKFQLNWTELLPKINLTDWDGPIVIRSPKYIEDLSALLSAHPNRVIHNSLIILFVLDILPGEDPTPLTCTKAVMSIMPEACSSLYLSQFTDGSIRDAIARSNVVFDLLKSHLKRAPNLRGTALVRLASLKMQAEPWPIFYNQTETLSSLEKLDITSDNFFQNVLRIYEQRKDSINSLTTTEITQNIWSYPIFSKAFYNSFSHKIAVPLSLILSPYFDANLPHYLHFSTVGTEISKEILRSVTKAFEDKTMKCVPSENFYSNSNRVELLITSGGFQIAYHSMLSLSGSKAMPKLPGLNLTSTQLFFLITAQEFCSRSHYEGIETDSIEFHEIVLWLLAQGGIASSHFECKYGSPFKVIQTCGVW